MLHHGIGKKQKTKNLGIESNKTGVRNLPNTYTHLSPSVVKGKVIYQNFIMSHDMVNYYNKIDIS